LKEQNGWFYKRIMTKRKILRMFDESIKILSREKREICNRIETCIKLGECSQYNLVKLLQTQRDFESGINALKQVRKEATTGAELKLTSACQAGEPTTAGKIPPVFKSA
jgi:hypothetical protein